MGKPRGYTPARDAEDAFMRLLDAVARFLFWAGAAATAISVGLLVYTFLATGTGSDVSPEQARTNIDLFGRILTPGVLALTVGATFMFWGEEVLSVLLLMGAAALYFSGLYVPLLAENSGPAGQAVLATLQRGGGAWGMAAVAVLIADVVVRVRARAQEGTRADQLKYGKGIKEERDIQNVFLGKCWQLPFCRKFVREKCPIYLTRRTCWKEQVGCMCEEKVIQSAMTGQVFSKEAILSTNVIPRNNRLSKQAKIDRCKSCVIYNEHQKHKYKVAVPTILLGMVGLYLTGREGLKEAVGGVIRTADQVVGAATFRNPAQAGGLAGADAASLNLFKEILLVCLFLIAIAYLLRAAEYVFFRLKI